MKDKFSVLSRSNIYFMSANAFNLEKANILLDGKGLTLSQMTIFKKKKTL